MTTKKVASPLRETIEVGDIIKDYWVWSDGSPDGDPDYYLIVEKHDGGHYLTFMLNTGQYIYHNFYYSPEIQFEKVA